MFFLVKGTVDRKAYMGEWSERPETRLVIADTWQEAEAKFINHFEDQGSDYAVTYDVRDVEVHPVIE